ncbi:hypothetical protein A2480_00835 [Candidatus Uhrbacteria bacterium RIFOXYC2_FULL_47_19]|uniref:GIY-YIG domain-containing protein n=1 Tax=Candidatus Uhrbacteria bacterium RIFOXYC2_FULL_47_19 TaxID=1802424 RepID=A0A1F7WGT1_9BACT|nr:MAG: hypothetical protein A2480_00835 [Candidatus Uhrbacteria bacterium RIFOXYC2_FULL_47_19]
MPLETDIEIETVPHYHVYMVRCTDGSLFTGVTSELEGILLQINSGRGPQYTRTRCPVFLVYSEEFMNEADAEHRAEFIRQLDRRDKESLLSESSLAVLE